MIILCYYCMDDKWIGGGRTPCPECNPDGEIEQQGGKKVNPMTTETNAERLEAIKILKEYKSGEWIPTHVLEKSLQIVIEQAERVQELESRNEFNESCLRDHEKRIPKLLEENARLRSELSTVHIIKRRNGKATIIGWNGERYVYQSESSARGGYRSAKRE